MIHEHNKPWKACNLRTVAQQNLLQKDGKRGMRAGGLDIPPVSHPPLPLCVGLGPPRYPLLGSQSPKWKVPESDRIHWTCGELGLSGPFHPREPVWSWRNVTTHTKTTFIAAPCELREDKDILRVCTVPNKASHIEPDSCTQSKCKAIQARVSRSARTINSPLFYYYLRQIQILCAPVTDLAPLMVPSGQSLRRSPVHQQAHHSSVLNRGLFLLHRRSWACFGPLQQNWKGNHWGCL